MIRYKIQALPSSFLQVATVKENGACMPLNGKMYVVYWLVNGECYDA